MTRDSLRQMLSTVLKSLALAALLIAVALPRWSPPQQLAPLVFLLDVSASMPEQDAVARWQSLQGAAQRLQPSGTVSLAFANNVAELADSSPAALGQARSSLDRSGTNIADALLAALARQPPRSASQIVVISDGWSQRGDTPSALQLARSSGVTVNWVALGSTPPPSQLLSVDAPASVTAGETFNVAVDVLSAVARRVRLSAQLAQADPLDLVASIPPGRKTLWLQLQAPTPGDQPLQLQLHDAATGDLLDARSPAATIDVRGRPEALYIAHGAAPLARSLRAGGWSVAETLPARVSSLRSLDAYSLIVLDDVGAGEAPGAFWDALEQAVTARGAGLLVLGGPRSFGAGGYRGSRLESMLPVTIERGRKEQRAAVLFALDKSGSMDSAARASSRLSYAREAVLQTLGALPATDRAAVLTFDVSTRLLAPFDAPGTTAGRLQQSSALAASGGTRGNIALQESARLLAGESAARRVLVLVSDGFLPDENLDGTLGALRAARVEFIALGVGTGEQFASLRGLARQLQGELFVVDEAAELPRLMRAKLDAGLGAVTRGPVAVRAAAAPPFAMPADTAWPPVLNYAVTRLRGPTSGILESDQGEPVLAAQQLGSGRVAVMPAGLGAWAPDWPGWSQWPRFAGGLASWLGGVQGSGRIELNFRERDGEIIAAIDATNGSEWNSGAMPVLQVSDPEGRSLKPTLHRAGPGRFEANLAATSLGRYRVTAAVGDAVLRRSYLHAATLESGVHGVNPLLDGWVRQGLVRYLPAQGLAALKQPAPAGQSISFGWLLAAWLAYLAALLADCSGVLVSFAQRWRSRANS